MKYKDRVQAMVQDLKNQAANVQRSIENNSITKEELEKSLMAITKKLENVSELISLESYS